MAADQADSIDTEAVAQAVLEELDTGTVVGDKVVVSRRGLLALAGTSLGAGALATLGVGTAAAADGAQDTSTGDVTGNNGGGVDVYLDELRDPGGDEVVDIDDTGAINAAVSGREWLFDSVKTKQIGSTIHFTGAYSGADPDARLDAALSAASANDTIRLEPASYTATRTISSKYLFYGQSYATDINAAWTFDSSIYVQDLEFNAEPELNLGFGQIQKCRFGNNVTIDTSNNIIRANDFEGNTLTLASGTSGNVIDANTRVSVTDNGTNTVGDNS